MTSMIVAVLVMAVINFAFKGAGPAILKDRELPPRVQLVIDAFSPALLTGLLVVALLGERWALFDWTVLPGLAVAGVGWRLHAPHLVCIAAGVGVTALVRVLQ